MIRRFCANFFRGLGVIQTALKNTAPALNDSDAYWMIDVKLTCSLIAIFPTFHVIKHKTCSFRDGQFRVQLYRDIFLYRYRRYFWKFVPFACTEVLLSALYPVLWTVLFKQVESLK